MSSDILPTAQTAEVPADNKATQELLVLRENHVLLKAALSALTEKSHELENFIQQKSF